MRKKVYTFTFFLIHHELQHSGFTIAMFQHLLDGKYLYVGRDAQGVVSHWKVFESFNALRTYVDSRECSLAETAARVVRIKRFTPQDAFY